MYCLDSFFLGGGGGGGGRGEGFIVILFTKELPSRVANV